MSKYNTIIRQIGPDLDRNVTLRGNVYQHDATGCVYGVVADTVPELRGLTAVFDYERGRLDYVPTSNLVGLDGWTLIPGAMHVTFNTTKQEG